MCLIAISRFLLLSIKPNIAPVARPTSNATPDASFKESFNKEKNERRTSDVSSHLDTCSTASANETERSPVVTEMRVLPPVDK